MIKAETTNSPAPLRKHPLLHSTNLVRVPSKVIASTAFNAQPMPLHIAGAKNEAGSLFAALNLEDEPARCGQLFQHYMVETFGYGSHAITQKNSTQKRYRNSYLRLIQDWGVDSNNAQSAVLKGWVESRFGLLPTYHKHAIHSINDRTWMRYVEDKLHSRYHNNAIYMQLDLLFEYCQWFIQRFHIPAERFKTLYRGVNAIEKQCVEHLAQRKKVIRFNNITSFTECQNTADVFGDTVLQVIVPTAKIVFFNALLPHHALHGEAEYLVIGGHYEATLL